VARAIEAKALRSCCGHYRSSIYLKTDNVVMVKELLDEE
jgi:hypothetical protein